MKNDYFEVSISLHYEDLTWIAKPFKYYFDPLNTYSVSVELEQFPTQIIERIKIELKNEMMNGREIYKFLNEIKKKLVQPNVEGVVHIHFKAVFINGPIY
ncbi:hypothetical protein [Paenibacillus naphthalenovorans]|uniref:hypothetical protein n=1 Tax=Paenibacillus naphthalenovorans TaxID=162209 RepID=UPI00088DC3C2|nr:hypothetical protein [Paenibacillus naphthalenovorans]SDJ67070.1 hypothetical protein SAMN05421868_1372 [Paenibacillus naphthalenovorans]